MPRGWGKVFSSLEEVQLAYDAGAVDLQARIIVRTDRDGGETKRIETTVGRAIFNLALPAEIGKYYNQTMGRKQLRQVVADCYRLLPGCRTRRRASSMRSRRSGSSSRPAAA